MEEQKSYYLAYNLRNKRVHMFPKGISPKLNFIVQLEFKFTRSPAH